MADGDRLRNVNIPEAGEHCTRFFEKRVLCLRKDAAAEGGQLAVVGPKLGVVEGPV
jgi:hypothetical protein